MRVQNQEFWWKSRYPNPPVEPGFIIPPYVATANEANPVELIYEEVRAKRYPHLPSRIGSAFVCLPEHKGDRPWCDPDKWPRGRVYRVRGTGNAALVNMVEYSNGFNAYNDGNVRGAYLFAEDYWASHPFHGRSQFDVQEVILDGTVVIEKLLAEGFWVKVKGERAQFYEDFQKGYYDEELDAARRAYAYARRADLAWHQEELEDIFGEALL